MPDQLKADLREAFSLHASALPADAAEHLRRIDYHPRTRRISPRVTVGAFAGAVATTGAVVSVVVLGSAPAAFAGWSATPTTASGTQTTTADANCQARLAAMPATAGTASASGWDLVTSDVRGPFSVVIYQDGSADATCFTGPSFTLVSQSALSGRSVSSEGSITAPGTVKSGSGLGAASSFMVSGNGSGDIAHMAVAHLNSTSDGPYTLVEGQVTADVTAVTLLRSDGEDIQASVGGGWFIAWWPGDLNATTAQITTPSGVRTQALSTLAPASPAGGVTCPSAQASTSALVCTGGSGAGGTSTGTVRSAAPASR